MLRLTCIAANLLAGVRLLEVKCSPQDYRHLIFRNLTLSGRSLLIGFLKGVGKGVKPCFLISAGGKLAAVGRRTKTAAILRNGPKNSSAIC